MEALHNLLNYRKMSGLFWEGGGVDQRLQAVRPSYRSIELLVILNINVTLSGKSNLILRENKAGFLRESHR